MQLDLLTYQPTPEEITAPPPQPPPPKPPNPHAIAWQETKAAFYLQTMNRLMSSTQCSQATRRHEIQRLHHLREQALAEIRRLSNAQTL